MLQPHKLFGNFFDDPRIADTRLRNFSIDVLAQLSKANGTGDYTRLINQLIPVINEFSSQLAETENALMPRKLAARQIDEIIAGFKSTMNVLRDMINQMPESDAVELMKAFYPRGVEEYAASTTIRIPVLLKRVGKLAAMYRNLLGDNMALKLLHFESAWAEAYDNRLKAKEPFTGLKEGRFPAREQLEKTLLVTMHAIGQKFPGNLLHCMSFFNFSLLFPPQAHMEKNVTAPVKEKTVA
ncbi:hypothetical protein [Foetidibacter luteolus]|uniref:hypothetical protein n=1 Tax=Foetidibacter luteolus TaxID=2608880 RepID=UPI00129B1FC1|nr:hypothetical protein [Foetidibacter luteolus]